MKTLKLRIKDKHAKVLTELATQVNFVWNYVNELSFKYLQKHQKFLSAYDIAPYTRGASKECDLHSQTIQAISKEYTTRSKQFKKARLRWRSSRRSLGWIPFTKSAVKCDDGWVSYRKHVFNLWDSYGLSKYQVRTGCFVQDSRNRWYVCLVVDTEKQPTQGTKAIGIDLGLKDLATCSDGTKIGNPRYFQKYQQKLAKAQRARKKKQVRNIHAKIANSRRDHLQKASTELVRNNSMIIIGNLNASKLIKTKMAKAVLDSGFSAFRTMLKYKCENAEVWFEEVDEKYTTQTCSCCGAITDSSPKGRAGLRIREWTCSACNTTHDRDINAAKNILRIGRDTLAGGIPSL